MCNRKNFIIRFAIYDFCDTINLYGLCAAKRYAASLSVIEMKCIYCGCTDSKVIDSRSAEDDTIIRRRRECVNCGKRFTTYETVENTPVFVIKRGGARQAFDSEKIKRGIIKACEKRPVSAGDIDKLVENVQKKVYNSLAQEITSKEIGEMVCEGLKEIDEVAYVRFASVYRSFTDTTSFIKELEKIVKKDK